MMPEAITRLFKEVHDSFSPLEGNPTNDDLLAIWETILPLLMVILYNQLKEVHSLTAILTNTTKYNVDQGNSKFVCLARLPLYDKTIADNASTVVRIHAEAAHKSRLNDYASFKATEHGVAKLLRDVVNKV
jgi:hypothetical protein